MQDYLIVDGYNIIGAWPDLTALKSESLELAREKLIEMLADYQAFSGLKTIIVFDAYQIPGQGGKYEQLQLQLLFTKEKETADQCIERLVTELFHKRRRIYVATSDFAEQNVIFGNGALRLPARELLSDIIESKKEIAERIEDGMKQVKNTVDSRLSRENKRIMEMWRRGK